MRGCEFKSSVGPTLTRGLKITEVKLLSLLIASQSHWFDLQIFLDKDCKL